MPLPLDLCHKPRKSWREGEKEKLSPPQRGRRQGISAISKARMLRILSLIHSLPKESDSRVKNIFQGTVLLDRGFHMQGKGAKVCVLHVEVSLEMFSSQEPEELKYSLSQFPPLSFLIFIFPIPVSLFLSSLNSLLSSPLLPTPPFSMISSDPGSHLRKALALSCQLLLKISGSWARPGPRTSR